MATETTYVEWHLTPRGWIRGTWAINKPIQSSQSPPEDRIETWVKTETTQDNPCAPVQKDWSLMWASLKHSVEDRQILRATIRTPAPETEIPKLTVWDFPLN